MNSTTTETVIALLPLMLGGIFSILKPFLTTQKDFNKDCSSLSLRSTEKIAKSLANLLNEFIRNDGFDNMQRGDGKNTPDLFDDVASIIARHTKINFRISCRLICFRSYYFILLIGFVVGICSLILFNMTESYNKEIIYVCVFTSVAQILSVFFLYTLTRKNENDEEIM